MNLFAPDQVALARQHVAGDPAARKIADGIFSAAEAWLCRDDAVIRDLMPDAKVPRTWTVNYVTGCPAHGSGPEGYRGYAQGGWKHDPFQDKWRVTCGVGGETYPSNDFEAFYRTGMQDRGLLTGPYADDGWGWRAEGSPYRHWFVAYCCEHIWGTVMAGLTALSRAYLLGGDARHAHKALVILDRIAEVYPDMDYATQAMYSVEFSPGYTGKMFNLISETMNARRLCEAVDTVRDAIPSDPAFGPSAEATRAKIERGVIGAAIDGVYRGQVRGNYGMHQEALLTAALASGDRREIDRAVDWVLNQTGEVTPLKEMLTSFDDYIFRDKAAHAEGLNFALHNLIFREGIGWESSPSYCSGWVEHLSNVAVMLERVGVRAWDRPKMRRMLKWAAEMVCLDRFTPAVGDAGSALGGMVQPSAFALRAAYRSTADPLIGELLRRRRAGIDGFESLFERPMAVSPNREGAAQLKRLTEGSRLVGGYGLALLRSGRGKERSAVSLYYGRSATEHAHFDRLTLELFGYDRKLIPDLGYPEHAAEGDTPAVWTKNTAAHATVVVDGRRQDTQAPGRPCAFVAGDGLSLVEVDAPETYHATSEYRRTVALIDLAPDARYVLDLFRVAGGGTHDYSLHGFDGAFSVEDLALSRPQGRGTLAGEKVPYGAIYDDDGLTDPLRKGRSYYTYRGGGYSYLYDVQRGRPSQAWSATWTDMEAGIGLRTTFLPSEEVIVAHGDPPRKPGNPRQLKYVILRNQGDGVASRFAAVIEPFRDDPKVFEVVGMDAGDGVGLRVRHQHGEDRICHGVGPAGTSFSLVRRDPEGQVVRGDLVGPGAVREEGIALTVERGILGRVVAIDDRTSSVEVEIDRESERPHSRNLIGEVALIGNVRRSAAYTITSVEGRGRRYRVGFGEDSFRIGRFVTGAVNPDGSGLSTDTYLYMAAQGYYRGARLADEKGRVWLPVEDVRLSPHRPGSRRDGRIGLVGGHDLSAFAPGRIAYLYDFGPGDSFSVVPHATAVRRPDGTFRVSGSCRAKIQV